MLTHYYAFGSFPGGDPNGDGLHIGKSLDGWIFLGRAHDDVGLTSRAAWAEFLSRPSVVVRTKCGRDVPIAEFMETMSVRRGTDGRLLRRYGLRSSLDAHPHWADRYLVDAEGYEFSRQDFC